MSFYIYFISYTRSLRGRWAPTSSWQPFGFGLLKSVEIFFMNFYLEYIVLNFFHKFCCNLDNIVLKFPEQIIFECATVAVARGRQFKEKPKNKYFILCTAIHFFEEELQK